MRNKKRPVSPLRENRAVYKVNKDTITIPVIEKIVERVVDQKLQRLLNDHDYGLELRTEFKQKLNSILQQKRKIIPEEKIAEKYGVKF